MTILVASNEILPISPDGGALERLALGWALGLSKRERVVLATFSHHRNLLTNDRYYDLRAWIDTPDELEELAHRVHAQVVILHNRPAWTHYLSHPTIVVVHNYSTAWGSPSESSSAPPDSVSLSQAPALFLGVSPPLLRHVQQELGLSSHSVGHLPPYVDPIFALLPTPSAPPHRRLLFPNRILKKKGIERTLQALEFCKDPTLRVDFVSNFSPNLIPDDEQRSLVDLINAHPQATLVPTAPTPRTTAALYGNYLGVITPSTEPEGFGLVPAEALVLGVAPACSSAGGLQELIGAGAQEIDINDPESFAHTLDHLAHSERRSVQQRRESWERFSFERSITALWHHIERCATLH